MAPWDRGIRYLQYISFGCYKCSDKIWIYGSDKMQAVYVDKCKQFKRTHKLLIIGAGGHGRVAADIAIKMKRWKKITFLDDDQNLLFSMGIKVIGITNDVFKYTRNHDIFVAIGNSKTREKIQNSLEHKGANIPILIHPNAIIGEKVEIGTGTVVMAGTVINCCSKIGKGCIINTGVTIDHDNIIENFVHLSPGVHTAGTVQIGKGSWIGIGAVISNNLNIISECVVGAGAVVVKNITETGFYVGVPAKKVNKPSESHIY